MLAILVDIDTGMALASSNNGLNCNKCSRLESIAINIWCVDVTLIVADGAAALSECCAADI